MDLKLKPFDFNQAVAKAGLAPDGTPLARARATQKGDFQTAMASALKQVSDSQLESSRLPKWLKRCGCLHGRPGRSRGWLIPVNGRRTWRGGAMKSRRRTTAIGVLPERLRPAIRRSGLA